MGNLSPSVRRALSLFNRGMEYFNSEKYKEAILELTKAIECAGGESYYGAFNNRGLAKYLIGDFEGAIQDFLVFVKWEPNVDTYLNIGNAHIELGRPREALDAYYHGLPYGPFDGGLARNIDVARALIEMEEQGI